MSIIDFITELSEINKMENAFSTPRDIDKDSLYFSELSKTYGDIKKIANKYSLSQITDEIENIEGAVEEYYNGQIDSALKKLEI